jgi:hypothetical protein
MYERISHLNWLGRLGAAPLGWLVVGRGIVVSRSWCTPGYLVPLTQAVRQW